MVEKTIGAQIGARISKMLSDAGLTQRAAAERLGISESTVSKWIKGGYNLRRYEQLRELGNISGPPLV